MSSPTALERLALDLLEIPSVIGNEQALADHVEVWARERGFERIVRAGDNLALVPRPAEPARVSTERPRLLLLGHLDTVPVSDANTPRVEGDLLFGLGATDMKAADAVILRTLARAQEELPHYEVAGILYAGEEGPFHGSGFPAIAQAAPDLLEGPVLGVAMEPTDNALEVGCLGTLHAQVIFAGQRAHSARPWEGRNAIHMAAPLLSHVAALEPREVVFDGHRFREVLSATMLDYEGARNVVPGVFRLNLNFRFAPDRTTAQAEAHLRGLVTQTVGHHGERVRVEVTDAAPSGRVCTKNPLVSALRAAVGPKVIVRSKQAWTDVGRLSEMGVDAINFGPGSGAQAHQVGEWCSRAQLAEAEAALARLLWPGA